MSGGMGYYDGDIYGTQHQGDDDFDDNAGFGQQQAPQQQKRNPLRDHLNKVEEQNSELRKQVEKLVAAQRRTAVADELRAKGYDPAVAGLYGGEPDKLDEWLTNVGPLLAKQPASTTGNGQPQQQGGAPASTVPAEGQAAMQQMQGMGNMAAPPAGSEAEQIAQIRNAQTPEALMQYLNGQGNPYFFNG